MIEANVILKCCIDKSFIETTAKDLVESYIDKGEKVELRSFCSNTKFYINRLVRSYYKSKFKNPHLVEGEDFQIILEGTDYFKDYLTGKFYRISEAKGIEAFSLYKTGVPILNTTKLREPVEGFKFKLAHSDNFSVQDLMLYNGL